MVVVVGCRTATVRYAPKAGARRGSLYDSNAAKAVFAQQGKQPFDPSLPDRFNVGGHRHATHAAKRRPDVACPRGPTSYATRVTSKYVRGFSVRSDSSSNGNKGSRAGSSFDTASHTTTATGSVVRFC